MSKTEEHYKTPPLARTLDEITHTTTLKSEQNVRSRVTLLMTWKHFGRYKKVFDKEKNIKWQVAKRKMAEVTKWIMNTVFIIGHALRCTQLVFRHATET